jgi:hypothetical protein
MTRRGRRALAPLSVGWRHRELILAVLAGSSASSVR